MRVLVVTPTYNEAANIRELLERVRGAVPDADILVVDDSSPDGTADVVRAAAAELGHIELTSRAVKNGLGAAYRHGFSIGLERGYDVLVQMDADLSHDPADIPRLLAGIEQGAALVIGSRYVPGGEIPHWPALRRAASKYGNLYTRLALGLQIRDNTAGFRAWRADTLRNIGVLDSTAAGYLFQIELAYNTVNTGGQVIEVPVIFTDRVRGNSKMDRSVVLEQLVNVTKWGIRDRFRKVFTRRR